LDVTQRQPNEANVSGCVAACPIGRNIKGPTTWASSSPCTNGFFPWMHIWVEGLYDRAQL
jgi:hypothetical protein